MSHLLDVLNTPLEEQGAIIREKVKDSQRVQEETLMDILELSRDTEFGRAHNFSEIKTVEDYRREIPVVEYDAFLEDVEKLKEGEENILFPGKTVQFVLTSGTTGKAKFLPQSELGKKLHNQVTQARYMELKRMVPESYDSHTFTVTNFPQILTTKGNINAGSASGVSAANLLNTNPNIVPPNILTSTGSEDVQRIDEIDYLAIMFGASDKTIRGFAGNDSSYLTYLLKILNDNFDKIEHDIRNGTISVEISDTLRERLSSIIEPNPERADELRKIYDEKGKITIEDMWPDFLYVVGWLSSSMGRLVEEFRDTFPEDITFYDAGYGASEGKFNLPVEENAKPGLPIVYGFFFEFKPVDSDEPVLLQETEPDQIYELIITTYSGLYRYNIKDLVQITKNDDGLYQIEFIGKSKDQAQIGEKTVYGSDIIRIIEQYEADHGIFISHIEGIPKGEEIIIRVEPRDDIDREDFTAFITEEMAKKDIPLKRVDFLEKGYRDSLRKKKIMDSLNRSQIKFMVFDPERYEDVD